MDESEDIILEEEEEIQQLEEYVEVGEDLNENENRDRIVNLNDEQVVNENEDKQVQEEGEGEGNKVIEQEEGEIVEGKERDRDSSVLRSGSRSRSRSRSRTRSRSRSRSVNSRKSDSVSPSKLPSRKKSKWHNEEVDEAEKELERMKKKQKKLAKLAKSTPDLSHSPSYSSVPETPIHGSSPVQTSYDTPPISNIPINPPPQPTFTPIVPCRSVDNYEKIHKISEGSYGVVYLAKDIKTEQTVALKKLKMEKEKEGFPITSLREINTLLLSHHENIVNVLEIVVGDSIDDIFIVMEFVEHDLKSLMESKKNTFTIPEIKTILLQLLAAVHHLHENWIIHRDLKTSNILFSNNGILKLADFGLARLYGSPLGKMTSLVVTLWYRAPELLLGAKSYSTGIDMWAVGCIFAELILEKPLFKGNGEIDQLRQIFKTLGTPNNEIWPGFSQLSYAQKLSFEKYPYNQLISRFPLGSMTNAGFDLLNRLLCYDPEQRMTAEEALKHDYFKESPLPKQSSVFPSWPSKAEGHKPVRHSSSQFPEA